MEKPQTKSSTVPVHILGYDWGRVELFDNDNYVNVCCQGKQPSGWYSAKVNLPNKKMIWERSMGIDRNYHSNPAALRPNIVPMLRKNTDLPPETIEILLEVFSQ